MSVILYRIESECLIASHAIDYPVAFPFTNVLLSLSVIFVRVVIQFKFESKESIETFCTACSRFIDNSVLMLQIITTYSVLSFTNMLSKILIVCILIKILIG